MNLQLQRLRKLAGFKTQADIARALGVKERTYASWEREEAVMSLAQACEVCNLLKCSLDELCGRWEFVKNPVYGDPRQQALNGYYESMNSEGREALVNTAKLMADGPSVRIEKEGIEPLSVSEEVA